MAHKHSGGCAHVHTHADGDPIDQNPNGPLELCTCAECGAPIMLDDKQHRIRVIVPNLMGYDGKSMPATYHAFYDPSTREPKPNDGRPVYEGLRPDFEWPKPA